MDIFAFKKVSTEASFLEACEVYADRLKTESEVKEKFGLADLDAFKENTALFIEKVAEAVAFLSNRKKAKKAKGVWRKKGVSVLYDDERCIITSPDRLDYARDAGSLINGENSCPWCVATKEPASWWERINVMRLVFVYRKENGVPVDAHCVVLSALSCFLLKKGVTGARFISNIEGLQNRGDGANEKVKVARFEEMLSATGLREKDFSELCLKRCMGVEFSNDDIFKLACKAGEKAIVCEMIESGYDVSSCSNEALNGALCRDDVEICRVLTEHGCTVDGDGDTTTRLRLAADAGAFRCCKYFLDLGDDVDGTGTNSFRTPLLAAIDSHNLECVTLLLNRGANANYTKDITRPLGSAAFRSNNADTMRLLLQHGAEVNGTDERNHARSALHNAAFCGLEDNIRTLVEHGADVNAKDSEGRTPLDICSSSVGKYLFSLGGVLKNPGSYFHLKVFISSPAELLELLERSRLDETKRAWVINGLLTVAARENNIDCVKLLIGMGGEVNFVDSLYVDNTALGTALLNHGQESEVVSYLLEHDADPNIKTFGGETLLERAVVRDSLELLSFLLENGADPSIPTSKGMSLVEYAELLGCDEIVKVLKEWNMRTGRRV